MIQAYVLINTKIGKTEEVAKLLKSMPEVKHLDVIMGPYDIISLLETDSHDSIANTVMHKMQTIDAINHTMTCPVVKVNF